MNTKTTKPNHNLTWTARLILWPAAALSAWGNTELFGGSTTLSMGIVLTAAIGLEVGMMTLIALGARERALRAPALAVGGCLLILSLLGQYAFLLSRASGHEEHVAHASRAEQDATTDQAATRAELTTVQAALAREQASGWGPKAQALATRSDALRATLDSLSTTAHVAAETQAHRSPLLVLTERFSLDQDLTLKAASALFLLGVNVAGFLLLYAANASAMTPAPAINGHAHHEPEAKPVRVIPARGIHALFEPAPDWLKKARQNVQTKCAPSALSIKLGRRPALN